MTNRSLAATLLLILSIAACGGGAGATPPSARSAAPAPGGASATGGGSATGSASAGATTPLIERDFRFDTPDLAVTGVVSLAVTNAGPTVHDVTIRDTSGTVLGETEDLKPGATETLTADLPAGTYMIFCSLPGHESLGLKGTLTVTR
jgi:plastocyanin